MIGSKVAFQSIRIISGYHHYFRDSGLPEVINHTLRDGNGSKLKHGLEVSHS
jgi:hypothetical protein